MPIQLATIQNADDVYLVWTVRGHPDGRIPGCLGFAIEGKRPERPPFFISNRMGFQVDNPQPHERRPSNVWPFQAYRLSDHAADRSLLWHLLRIE